MTIKTYDGVDLVKKFHDQQYGKYPEGSLSPREVMKTIPAAGDLEKLAFKTNSVITKAIYKKAEEFAKANPPEKTKGFKMSAVSDVVPKTDDSKKRAEELSAEVLKAIDTVKPE